jgi:GNAT superfamily N-acetyltransferase
MISVIDHRERETALAVHALQMAAYAQEAALLGVTRFPPLEETPEDVQGADAVFLGAWLNGALVGAVGVEAPDGEEGERLIGSLVVSPIQQRRGLGAMLVEGVLTRFGGFGVRVSTGAKNVPALALFARYGFVPFQRLTLGEEEPVEVIRLRWVGAAGA